MESIVFHARKSKENKTPMFTVRFGMEKQIGTMGTLFCVVSKPHPGLESYCKVTGNDITEARLECLTEEYEQSLREVVKVENVKHVKDLLPRGVTKNLSFYASRAKRFFQLEETDPRIIIRGTKLSWERTGIGSMAKKTPVTIIANLSALDYNM